jgi:hypothetical protein
MSIAGHVSQKMANHYSRVRSDAKRRAPDRLAGATDRAPIVSETVGYDTNSDTKAADAAGSLTQVVGLIGGADGARTRDLRRDRPAF